MRSSLVERSPLTRAAFRGFLWIGWWLLSCSALGACGPTLEPELGHASVDVSSMDGRPLDASSPAPRLRLELADVGRATELFDNVRLIEGELSSYAEGHLRDGELTASLLEREVALSVWSVGDALLVQPARFLDSGVTYTLAASGFGELASLVVGSEAFRLLPHVWPEALTPGGSAVYCADGEPLETALWQSSDSTALAPSGMSSEVLEGVGLEAVDAGRCVTLVMPAGLGDDFVLPPIPAADLSSAAEETDLTLSLFDPRPLAVVNRSARVNSPSSECTTQLGPACASFVGTELLLEGAPPGAWALRATNRDTGAAVTAFSAFTAGSRVAFHGFDAGATYVVSATYFDTLGRTAQAVAELAAGAPSARFVLNEVLANALGAEPESEWIEVVNVGLVTASLEGMSLQDSGGSVPLPAVELAPGEFGLIVGGDYSAVGADVVPNRTAVPIVVPRVGQGGLANSGEPLRLVNAAGEVLSSVPALAASRPGISWARRDPWAPDAPESFGEHAAPGASPGAMNVLSE